METEAEGSLGLWAVPRMVVVTQAAAGGVFLVMALVNLAGPDPSGRFLGLAAAVVAGLSFGADARARVSPVVNP